MGNPTTFEATTDASLYKALPRPAVFHVATSEQGLKLLEVEGELDDAEVTRWAGILRTAIKEGATGIAVDLRGCGAMGPVCLSALLAASSTLRARGGGGVRLVTYPRSRLDRRLQADPAKRLPADRSAMGALVSLREAN